MSAQQRRKLENKKRIIVKHNSVMVRAGFLRGAKKSLISAYPAVNGLKSHLQPVKYRK
jgi:hypothetical protein